VSQALGPDRHPAVHAPGPAPLPLARLGPLPAIAIVLLAGLALRLLLAFVVFPRSGLWSDINLFADWSLTLADHGPWGFYENVGFSDYTPGYLAVLWLFGTAAKVVAGLTGGVALDVIPVWIKLPAILADLLVAWVFYRAIRRWHGERWGIAVAAAYLFVPVTWYDSALWGQVDAVGVLVGGLALIWLIDRRPELAAAAAMAAVLVKPQFGFFLPIVGLVLLRRHLRRPTPPSGAVAEWKGDALDPLRGWWARQDRAGPVRLVTSALAALAVLLVVVIPFDLETRAPAAFAGIPVVGDIAGLASLVATTAGSYDVLTANAYNPWALVGPTPLVTAIGGDYIWTYDTLSIFGLPASLVGTLAFLAVSLAVAVLLWRRQDRDAILIAAVTLAVAFFVLPTRVHERYLFAAIGLGVLLLPRSRAWWAWFTAASTVALVNMHAVLSLPFRGYGTPEMRALPFADLAREPVVVAIVSLTCVPVLAWPLIEGWRLWRTGRTAPGPDPDTPGAQLRPAILAASTTAAPAALPARRRPMAVPMPGDAAPETSAAPGRPRAAVRGEQGPPALTPEAARSVALPATWTVVIIIVASLVAAFLAIRLSGIAGGWLWNWDVPHLQYPFAAWFNEALAGGGLPLWQDRMGMGYPLYANPQTGAFYPLNWLIHQLPPLHALDATRVLHLALAGVGVGVLVLRLTGVRTAAIVAAVIATASGGAVAKLQWTELIATLGWVPWVLLPLVWHRRPPGAWAVLLAGLLWGVQALAGHPPIWALTGIAAAVVLVHLGRSVRALGAVVLLGVTGVAVAAVQLVPIAVLLPLSARSGGLEQEQLFRFSASAFDVLGFAFANAFVEAHVPAWDLTQTWHPGGTWGLLEAFAYVGLPVLVLAAVGLRVRRARWLVPLAIVLLAIPVLGAFRPALWAEIPGLNGLRHPVRAYAVVGLLLAVAAGVGLARLQRARRDGPRPWRWPFVFLVVPLLAYVLVTLVVVLAPEAFRQIVAGTWMYPTDGQEEAIRSMAEAALTRPWPLLLEVTLGVAVLVLIAARWRRRAARMVRMAGALILVVPLLLLIPGVNQLRPEPAFDWSSDPVVSSLTEHASGHVVAIDEPHLGYSNQLALAGIRDLHVFAPLDLTANDEVLAAARADPTLARAVGVDTFVVFGGVPCPAGEVVATIPERNAAICHLDSLRAPYWIPSELVTLEGEASPLRPQQASADPAAVVASALSGSTLERDAGTGVFEVSAPADGFVFVDRSWYPWWEASVDGERVPVHRLWSGQLVPVTAGDHRIEQRFVPWDMWLGLAITLAALSLIAGAWLWRRWGAEAAMAEPAHGPGVGAAPGPVAAARGAGRRGGAAVATGVIQPAASSPSGSARVTLEHERGPAVLAGRIGRRDVLAALLVLVVLAGMRLHMLERPLGFYFDEVLHGRTATEMLQDWRYGRPHEILEWTHPHLSKYLMAAGIEALGGHEVNRVDGLGLAVRDAAVEPASGVGDGGVTVGTRVFLATDDSIVVHEPGAEEARRHILVEGATRLGMEVADRLLWAGTETGAIWRIDTSSLDPEAAGSSGDPPAQVLDLGTAVDGLWALPEDGVAAYAGGSLSIVTPEGLLGSALLPDVADVVPVPVEGGLRLAVVVPSGLELRSLPDLALEASLPIERRPLGADLVEGDAFLNRSRALLPESRLFVATRGGLAVVGGVDGNTPFVEAMMPMPGPVRDVRWNASTNLVHVLGEEAGRPTIYVVEPHGRSVFADAELPMAPVAWGLDVRPLDPARDGQQAVAVGAEGTVATAGTGGTLFGARLPGALLGALAGALLFLLLRLLSPSRLAAAIGIALIATETLLFSQSRIATPDIVTIAFILGAYVLLAWLLSHADLARRRALWLVGLPLVGVLLGLAASTKWTGFYAFGGVALVLLLLVPRARWLAVGAAALVAVALTVRTLLSPEPNLALVGVLAVVVALLAGWVRSWERGVGGAAGVIGGRLVAYGLVSIGVAGVLVYVLSYVPYLFLAAGDPQLIGGWPPGHSGETFLELQARMLGFHGGLEEGHGSGSPWWSWPLMLKPLWAYLEGFDDAVGSILMPANPVVVWLSLPVVAWAGWRLLRRLDAALLLLLAGFALQWLPWALVERVSFFYHYATALPFALALLALLLARAWTDPSRILWLGSRVAVIVMAALPVVLWAGLGPLCTALNSDPSASVCTGAWSVSVPLSALLAAAGIVVSAAVAGGWWLRRWGPRAPSARLAARAFAELMAAVAVAGLAVAALALVGRLGVLGDWQMTISDPVTMVGIWGAIAVLVVAAVLGVRSPRVLVGGLVVAAVAIAIVLYPTLVGTPLDAGVALLYQSLLPTWDTSFIFGEGSQGLVAALVVIGLPLVLVTAIATVALVGLDRRVGWSGGEESSPGDAAEPT
jgi:hypothetical protein